METRETLIANKPLMVTIRTLGALLPRIFFPFPRMMEHQGKKKWEKTEHATERA
jgi:hypothetical protein